MREGPVKIENSTRELQEAVAEVAVNTGTWSIVLALSPYATTKHNVISWECLLIRLLSRVGRELLIRVISGDYAQCKAPVWSPVWFHRKARALRMELPADLLRQLAMYANRLKRIAATPKTASPSDLGRFS
jgi:hypothetical protein